MTPTRRNFGQQAMAGLIALQAPAIALAQFTKPVAGTDYQVLDARAPVEAPRVVPLPQGAMFRRIGMVVDMGDFAVANVHLSHGQVLNRRQLWRIAAALPDRAAVLGDFNLVGPCLLPGFRDVGPREPTHRCVDMVPLRIDRCLVRGLDCLGTAVLGRASSDHHPIVVRWAATANPLRLAA